MNKNEAAIITCIIANIGRNSYRYWYQFFLFFKGHLQNYKNPAVSFQITIFIFLKAKLIIQFNPVKGTLLVVKYLIIYNGGCTSDLKLFLYTIFNIDHFI